MSLGPSSEGTVSNPDWSNLNEQDQETWKAKHAEYGLRLQCAKEQEKALKAQLNAQCEHLWLETQERENHRLELDLIQNEQDRVAQDKEQERVEALQSEKAKLLEVVHEQEHCFELEKECLKAEFNERQMKLEHDISMYEMEIEQGKSEMELQR